jgi:SAM-dependent methyltransferase
VGLYSRHVFPFVLERAMRRPSIAAQRAAALTEAHSEVLEIGFGSGLNLKHYPSGVKRVVGVEPHPKLRRRAADRAAADRPDLPLELVGMRADGTLPLDAGRFDCAVSTWTLCTIPDVAAALREVHRLLKPGGRFLFVEHGLAPDEAVRRWQRRLRPLIRYLGDGCTLDRDIADLIRASPLHVERCDTFYLPDTPRVGGFTYRGWAAKS